MDYANVIRKSYSRSKNSRTTDYLVIDDSLNTQQTLKDEFQKKNFNTLQTFNGD
jgi:hypothetical protein